MEVWKDIQGYEGLYQVSNQGRVKSLERRTQTRVCHEKIMNSQFDTRYLFVRLSKDGKKRNLLIHRLVANEFIPNRDGCPYVNHINGKKTDNRVENLEWCTPSENTVHAIVNDIKRLPNKSVVQCDLQGNTIREWESIKEASVSLKINRSNIGSCCNRKRNKAGNYTWKFREAK